MTADAPPSQGGAQRSLSADRYGRAGATATKVTPQLVKLRQYALMEVTLRRPRFEDWERVHEWTSTIDACRFQTWGPNTPADTRAFVEAAVDSWKVADDERRRYVWAAEHEDMSVVGLGELHVTDPVNRQGDISYSVHTELWGRGFARAIANELLRFGFEEQRLHRIVGTCDPRNVASEKVLRSAGMTYEGRARHTLLLRDGWRDSQLFSVLENEWLRSERQRS